jgi:hypothetical protein
MTTRKSGSSSYVHTTKEGQEVEVTLTFKGYYDPGCSSGLPENCYPPEGEIEILTATTTDGVKTDFDDWSKLMNLTPEDVTTIEVSMWEAFHEQEDNYDY